MLAISSETVQAIDHAVQFVGVGVALVLLIDLLRSGRWRSPLAGCRGVRAGPSLLELFSTIAMFVALLVVLLSTFTMGVRREDLAVPGSHAWHMALTGDTAARLLICFPLLVFLRRHRSFSRPAPLSAAAPGSAVRVAMLALLVTIPVCMLQLHATQLVWNWLMPQQPPPTHAVLLAFHQSAWGVGGQVQLLVATIAVAPLAEELFFRGLVLQTVWNYTGRLWWSIVISALAFGLIHTSQAQDVLPLITLGLVQGFIRVRWRSLAACVLVHSLFNARTMILLLLAPDLMKPVV